MIDATAEGDIAAGAGCRYRLGRERRSRREPHAGVIHYFRAEDRLLPGSTGRGDREHFRSVEAVGYIEHPYSRRDEHFDIFLCREFTGNLQRAWSELKKYD